MGNKQVQNARDGSQQVQMINPTIVMGIDEKRVREVCSEMAVETIKQCTHEASAIAIERIEKFTIDLIPRVEKIENDFKSFSEPSFQFELRNAQKVAACTDRECDYELLSELLVHRIEKGEERKIKLIFNYTQKGIVKWLTAWLTVKVQACQGLVFISKLIKKQPLLRLK